MTRTILLKWQLCLALILWLPLTAFAHLISISATSPFPSNVVPSSTKVAVYTVTNTASHANVTIVDQSLFPSSSGLAILQSGSTCLGALLTPGASCTLEVQLIAPATAQTISAELREWASPTADGVQYPISVNVTHSISNSFAYIPSAQGANPIYLCQISASDGSLNNCATTINVAHAGGLTILGNFAYFGNSNASGLITVCSINPSSGALTSCSTSGSNFNGPYGINFNAAGTRAYIANNGNSTVTLCPVNTSTGALISGSCSTTGSTFSAPLGIVLSPSGSFAYITNSNNNTVSVCAVNSSTGTLSACTVTSGFSYPWGITFNAAGNFVYIANLNNNTVSLCPVNSSTGALGTCTSTGSNFNGPNGIVLNAAGTLAYVSNYNITTATVCSVNSSTGLLSGCSLTGGTFNFPNGIALY